ncbi:MAG: hypothetical protein LBD98_00160 [Endomicrobium sp.]|jgi:hypothetical protein|nr:hypothetical protein [Endomicrobium sp.]
MSKGKTIKKTIGKGPKIQLKLADIYNIEIPIALNKVQKEIDNLSSQAKDYLKKSVQKTQEIEAMLKK